MPDSSDDMIELNVWSKWILWDSASLVEPLTSKRLPGAPSLSRGPSTRSRWTEYTLQRPAMYIALHVAAVESVFGLQ